MSSGSSCGGVVGIGVGPVAVVLVAVATAAGGQRRERAVYINLRFARWRDGRRAVHAVLFVRHPSWPREEADGLKPAGA